MKAFKQLKNGIVGQGLNVQERIEKAKKNQTSELDLSKLGLTELPDSIGELTQLQFLILSNNNLTALPESIGQLVQLRDLRLPFNQLTTLPESVSQLAQLQSLYLSGNRLTELPESIGQLTQLQYLNLSDNQLMTLPESIGQLAQLQILYLSGNQLVVLPESIGQLTQLQSLDLWKNQLTALPASIGQLAQLRTLYLSGNPLMALPESLCQLALLRTLYLANNQLTSLPESICQLAQLQDLDLSKNELTVLPESIGQVAQLQYLNLSNNQLTALPESLRNLKSLRKLDLGRNPGIPEPTDRVYDVTEKLNDVLNLLFKLGRGKRPLNEAKLIFVGRGGVGKTSLINRLIHKRFDGSEKKTEGINITEWPIVLNGNENVRLNVWDFGGQEIMHATHQFFLTARSLYVLVLNGREGLEDMDAEYWLKLIESFGGESPVIVVMNKINEHAFDVNRRALLQKYPFIVHDGFLKTDCENGAGIDGLRQLIERETDRLDDLRVAFPASWFTIKDQLAGIKRNYLSFDEYRKVCAEQGEMDSRSQESLAFYLHNLGIALNYKDDPRLQDTHVLNPHWVTGGIYHVLNAQQLEAQQGEIRLTDLAAILDATDYPRTMHRFIFDLMKKFELCFSFPDDDTHYLIPELLDKQQPAEAEEFRPQECLNFQYHYSVLPEGLLPRFIVRTHSLSEGLQRWRTGVILRFEDCRALVKADVQDKKVFINVSGPPAGRRRLLAIIRSDFERIHRDIRNLNPDEIVPLPDYPDVVVLYKKLLVMEQRGVARFTEVVDDDVIELDVQELLNGVDLEGTRRAGSFDRFGQEPLRVFISYSHKDETLRLELETHLKLMQRQRVIETWNDRQIEIGEEWKHKIDGNLERADIILLLVSADFIASDYCYEKEMKRALERQDKKEARVIPIILRDVNWQKAPFARLQGLPKNAQPVTKWADRDSAWRNVAEGIEKVAEEIRRQAGR